MSPTASRLPTDLTGRTFVITGATSGIGRATAEALAARGARIVLAVRNPQKGAEVAASLPGDNEVCTLDLSSLASVRSFAAEWHEPIDVLINNAGVSSPERLHSEDGFELQFATNYLGPFALTNLLLPFVTGRVVTLSSQIERRGRIDLDDPAWERRPYKESQAYAASKLADLIFTAELQRRLIAAGSSVLSIAAHPGLVATNMTGQTTGVLKLLVKLLAQSPADGASPVLLAAVGDVPGDSFTGPERLMHMRGGAQLIGRSKQAQDSGLGRQLWDVSEELTGVRFPLTEATTQAEATLPSSGTDLR